MWDDEMMMMILLLFSATTLSTNLSSRKRRDKREEDDDVHILVGCVILCIIGYVINTFNIIFHILLQKSIDYLYL